ncbi:LAFE_0D09692g1_1 [Lachancea fermentati]|uniref:LAFE_0D09692g1_1 n=1 Tax=Lachancea fermentati TaxID=4955 RepID=A0A1G4MCA2_LACFM|nr:LAFE_0D09692g1_1 [Lachancea fermentati]
MAIDNSVKQLYSTIEFSSDVLVSSYLLKKSSSHVASVVPAKHSYHADPQSSAAATPTEPSGSHHWFLKGGNSQKYWCVLRRGQLSYYKDKSERKAVNVIPPDGILNFRVLPEELRLDIYTTDRTLQFKADNEDVLLRWKNGLQEFLNKKKPSPKTTSKDPAKAAVQDNEIENEDEMVDDDNDEDYEIISEVDLKQKRNSTDSARVIHKIPEEDKEFYAMYNPTAPMHVIQSGILYGRVKKRLGRKSWKKFKVTLNNEALLIKSASSGRSIKTITLDRVVDCVEVEGDNCYTCFAVITFEERLKFRALNEKETVDWIINLKSCVLARKKLMVGHQVK